MTFYHRNLPHFQPKGATFFVTFRLSGSIPVKKLAELRKNYEIDLKNINFTSSKTNIYDNRFYDLQKLYFAKYDNLLDTGNYGPKWLSNNDVANLVWNKIHSFNNSKYELIALCIMPNHVHIVNMLNDELEVSQSNEKGKTKEYLLADVLRLIKGSSARESNKLLNRTGSFWQHESYDHVVRNEKELNKIILYVLNNPVKAGLVKDWKEWKWNYSLYNS